MASKSQTIRKGHRRGIVVTPDRTAPPPRIRGADVMISDPVNVDAEGTPILGNDRLTFDGYALTWHGASSKSYTGFSGPADEGAKESEKDIGPTPQGKYAVDPANIEDLQPSPDWGKHRVRIEPYKATVDRMTECFKLLRTGMYIHGGSEKGSHGCIELNNDADEDDFFARLKRYGRKIELEIKYAGAREAKYEDTRCPY